MNRPKALPEALTSSDNFRSLTDSQRKTFIERLLYIEETYEKYFSRFAEYCREPQGFRGFLDDLELDVGTNLVTSSDSENETFTCWAMHVTWAREAHIARMNSEIGDKLREVLEGEQIFLDSNKEYFLSVLKNNLKGIGLSLSGFYDAKNFDSAIAHLIVLDAVLANILRVLYFARLNPGLI